MCILRALSHHFNEENLLLLVLFLLALLHSQGHSPVVADPSDTEFLVPEQTALTQELLAGVRWASGLSAELPVVLREHLVSKRLLDSEGSFCG